MITYREFKEIMDKTSDGCEIGIYFNNDFDDYLVVKFKDYITIGKFNCAKNEIYKFSNIDELYNATIENMCLKRDWNKIADILIDLTFSIIEDKDEIKKIYNVDL